MKAGKLRHRITIQQATETLSATGAVSLTWATLATVWAERMDLSGREFFQASQVNAEKTVKFRIRYRADLTAKMRVVHEGKTYDLAAALDEKGRKIELLLMCRYVGP